MNKMILNQLIITLPIHILAYAPFLEHLRWGKKRTFLLVTAAEGLYILLFSFLLYRGFSPNLLQGISLPLFGLLFFLSVDMEPGKIMFLYIFSISYLLFIRGTASFVAELLYPDVDQIFYSNHSSVLCIVLFILTLPGMLRYIKSTARMVFENRLLDFWKTAWILPGFNVCSVLLFTFSPKSNAQIGPSFLLARILQMLCMFMVYYLILRSIDRLQKQSEAEAQARYLEQLIHVQSSQYALLDTYIAETRQAQHDLRQHLRVVQSYIDRKDFTALSAYIRDYSGSLPSSFFRNYCKNHAVNSILSFYAEKAESHKIHMDIAVCPLAELPIPEPDFCVLLGNLLENALEACCRAPEASPVIRLRAESTGYRMLTLTVDNSCSLPPVSRDGHFISSKNGSFGTGTESIRRIAHQYQGDARFSWKDGMFYVSVMLNP